MIQRTRPIPTQSNALRRGIIHAIAEAESSAPLTVRELELLRLGFRHGAEAKADEVQPMITSLELRALQPVSEN